MISSRRHLFRRSANALSLSLQLWRANFRPMDAVSEYDLRRTRCTAPEVKLAQALELMRLGFELRAAALRERYPTESEAQLAARLRAWLHDGA